MALKQTTIDSIVKISQMQSENDAVGMAAAMAMLSLAVAIDSELTTRVSIADFIADVGLAVITDVEARKAVTV